MTGDIDDNWTLQKHTSYIQERFSSSEIPEVTRVVVSDSPVTRLLKEILLRDYLDISFSNAPVRARRVLSPTNEALTLLQQQEHHQLQSAHRHAKSARQRDDRLVHADSSTPHRREEIVVQLAHITWFRWKVQESFLGVAEELIRVGYFAGCDINPELDLELVLKVVQQRPKFTVNPDEGKITEEISKASSYALWLPHGIRLGDFLPTWTERYSQVMEAYYIATGKRWEDFEDVEKRMGNLLTMEMELYI
ncbi:hypothetical protein V1525DRAFT_446076 [Lipomyces kononenkoae]|uniref:Uncharacterized protein n=1 Tax=Lipomyces kononenkoae TaxID=34357 RepID=A0ACC3SXU7_LIPKO